MQTQTIAREHPSLQNLLRPEGVKDVYLCVEPRRQMRGWLDGYKGSRQLLWILRTRVKIISVQPCAKFSRFLLLFASTQRTTSHQVRLFRKWGPSLQKSPLKVREALWRRKLCCTLLFRDMGGVLLFGNWLNILLYTFCRYHITATSITMSNYCLSSPLFAN